MKKIFILASLCLLLSACGAGKESNKPKESSRKTAITDTVLHNPTDVLLDEDSKKNLINLYVTELKNYLRLTCKEFSSDVKQQVNAMDEKIYPRDSRFFYNLESKAKDFSKLYCKRMAVHIKSFDGEMRLAVAQAATVKDLKPELEKIEIKYKEKIAQESDGYLGVFAFVKVLDLAKVSLLWGHRAQAANFELDPQMTSVLVADLEKELDFYLVPATQKGIAILTNVAQNKGNGTIKEQATAQLEPLFKSLHKQLLDVAQRHVQKLVFLFLKQTIIEQYGENRVRPLLPYIMSRVKTMKLDDGNSSKNINSLLEDIDRKINAL